MVSLSILPDIYIFLYMRAYMVGAFLYIKGSDFCSSFVFLLHVHHMQLLGDIRTADLAIYE